MFSMMDLNLYNLSIMMFYIMKLKNKPMNKLLILLIYMFSLISLQFTNFFIVWFIMEMISFTFITLLTLSDYKNNMLIYFITSILSSFLLLIGIMNFNENNFFINLILMISIMIKLNLFPFHLWFIFMAKNMKMNNLFHFMTIMKITPMYMYYLLINFNQNYFYMLIFSMLLTSIFSLKMKSFKLLLAFSSIYQTSFIIILLEIDPIFSLIYFIIYILVNMIIFKQMNNFIINQINDLIVMNKMIKWFINLNMIIYSQLPPMFTFFLKWMLIEKLTIWSMNFFMIYIIMMISSLIFIFNYINYTHMYFFEYSMKINHKINNFKLNYLSMILYSMLIFMFMYMSFYLI